MTMPVLFWLYFVALHLNIKNCSKYDSDPFVFLDTQIVLSDDRNM